MNYYIADTHFFHENIIRYDYFNGGKMFRSIEEHDNLIISNINNIVTLQDNLYFLGDISWGTSEQTTALLKQIKCRNLFAIRGNHDRVLKSSEVKKLFQGIYDIKQIEDNGKQLILSHFPQMMWSGQHRGVFHLYGHVHNSKEHDDFVEFLQELDKRIKERDGERYRQVHAYNVGCMLDYMDYTPRTLAEIISYNKN